MSDLSFKFLGGITKTISELADYHHKFVLIEHMNGDKLFAYCNGVVVYTADLQSSHLIVSMSQHNVTNKYIYLKNYRDVHIVEIEQILNLYSSSQPDLELIEQ